MKLKEAIEFLEAQILMLKYSIDNQDPMMKVMVDSIKILIAHIQKIESENARMKLNIPTDGGRND